MVIYPGLCAVLMILSGFIAFWSQGFCWFLEIILGLILIWMLSFFRDPKRIIPQGNDLLLSPADGTITDVQVIDNQEFIGGPAIRVGIFLSVFNVHLNRAPCKVRIETIDYHKGAFINAMDANCGKLNESNDLGMTRLDEPKEKLYVRQISGAIARRIECDAEKGQEFSGGEIFGMIKFGSRTELYLPAQSNAKILVKKGDKVKAGLTILAKYDGTNK
ncbi:MAG: phosphatidylserine decarboxylase [Planctomycetes bacterium GWF2_42_9]|nr:MAG: phosphatidylserine decarboxylase [Planctomycetes bacterium GWF2_42_9]